MDENQLEEATELQFLCLLKLEKKQLDIRFGRITSLTIVYTALHVEFFD